jgi:hypothetical protein
LFARLKKMISDRGCTRAWGRGCTMLMPENGHTEYMHDTSFETNKLQ